MEDNGIKTTEELQNLTKEYQTGEPLSEKAKQMNAFLDELRSERGIVPDNISKWGPSVDLDIVADQYNNSPVVEDYSTEAINAGWGQSRLDSRIPYEPGMDLEQARALEQSRFAKIGK